MSDRRSQSAPLPAGTGEPDAPPPADEPARLGVGELADRGGVSRRTVRYYVQRGLLAPPEGAGRGAYYTAEHLERLIRIRELQEAGTPLDAVARALDGGGDGDGGARPGPGGREAGEAPVAQTWTRVALAEGVELLLRERRPGPEQLRALAEAVEAILGLGPEGGA